MVIVDAGGGTIDISSYSKDMTVAKDAFEEISAPQCEFIRESCLTLNLMIHCAF